MEIRNKPRIGFDIGARPGREDWEGIPEEMNQVEDGVAGRRGWSAVMRNGHSWLQSKSKAYEDMDFASIKDHVLTNMA